MSTAITSLATIIASCWDRVAGEMSTARGSPTINLGIATHEAMPKACPDQDAANQRQGGDWSPFMAADRFCLAVHTVSTAAAAAPSTKTILSKEPAAPVLLRLLMQISANFIVGGCRCYASCPSGARRGNRGREACPPSPGATEGHAREGPDDAV